MGIQGIRWLSFNTLMKKLDIGEIELFQIIQQNKIPAYRLLSDTKYLDDVNLSIGSTIFSHQMPIFHNSYDASSA